MKRYLVIVLGISFILVPGRSQERNILYSQYRFNGLAINPAYAGSHDVFSASMMRRMQWIGFEGAPAFENLNFHFPGKNTKTGWGGNIMHESVGTRSYFSAYANYAYRLSLGTGTMALGLKGGFSTGKHDMLDLGGNDPVYAGDNENYLLPNFGIGLYYYTNRYFAGLSVPLILGYETGKDATIIAYHDFSKYNYFLTGGIFFNLDEDWRLSPSFLAQYQRSTGLLIDGTVNVLYKEMIGAGLSYRTSKALIILVSYRIGYQTTVGVAYDFGFGGINQYNRSSLEVAIQVDLGFKINRSNPTIF